jgi:hypothetical protein
MANMMKINGLTYRPKDNPEWFTRALFGGRLVQGGYVRVLTGVKGDEQLKSIDLENKILQADGRDCAWNPNQIIKLSEKTAKVKTYKINLEQCIDELENKRTLYELSEGAKNESLPAELEGATLALIAMGLSNEIEELIIAGDESVNPNHFNGFVKQLLTSPDAIRLQNNFTTVKQAIEAAYLATPERVLQAEDAGSLFILGSYKARRQLRMELAEANNMVIGVNWTIDDTDKRNPKMFYMGAEFVPVKGLNDKTFIIYDSSNALLLTDLMGDLDDVELGNFPKPMDNKIWVKGRLRLGFAIPFDDEVVICSDKVTGTTAQGEKAKPIIDLAPNSLVFAQAGEEKQFKATSKKATDTFVFNATGSGFTVTKLTDTGGVATFKVVASDNTGNRDPRVGQVLVRITDTENTAVVTLNQRNDKGEIQVNP